MSDSSQGELWHDRLTSIEERFQNQPELKGGPMCRKPLKVGRSRLGHLVCGTHLVLCAAFNAHHKEGQGGQPWAEGFRDKGVPPPCGDGDEIPAISTLQMS